MHVFVHIRCILRFLMPAPFKYICMSLETRAKTYKTTQK